MIFMVVMNMVVYVMNTFVYVMNIIVCTHHIPFSCCPIPAYLLTFGGNLWISASILTFISIHSC